MITFHEVERRAFYTAKRFEVRGDNLVLIGHLFIDVVNEEICWSFEPQAHVRRLSGDSIEQIYRFATDQTLVVLISK